MHVKTCLQSGSFFLIMVVTFCYWFSFEDVASPAVLSSCGWFSSHISIPNGAIGIPLVLHCHFYIIVLSSLLKYCLLPFWFWSFVDLWVSAPHSLKIFGCWLSNTAFCHCFYHNSWQFQKPHRWSFRYPSLSVLWLPLFNSLIFHVIDPYNPKIIP